VICFTSAKAYSETKRSGQTAAVVVCCKYKEIYILITAAVACLRAATLYNKEYITWKVVWVLH